MIPFEQFAWSLGFNPDTLDDTQRASLRRVFFERYPDAADAEDVEFVRDDDDEDGAIELGTDSPTNAGAARPRLLAGATVFKKTKAEGWALRWNRALTPHLAPAIQGVSFVVFDKPAFLRSYREAANGTRDIRLTIDHGPRRVLASTSDNSLVLHLQKTGLRWWVDLNTVRGRAAAAWLKANPDYRAVSIGGAATDWRISHLTAHVERFDFTELSFVIRPASRDAGFYL